MPSMVEAKGPTRPDRARLDQTSTAPAVALAVASGLHLAALPDHAGEGLVIAGFFLATAAFQLTAAWVVGRGGAGARARTGIAAGNLALVVLWAWSRMAGLPLGDHAGPEEVFWLDGLAVAAEIVAVAGLCRRRDAARDRRTGLAGATALLAIMVVTGAGSAQWLPPSHASHDETDHEQEHQHDPVHPEAEVTHVTPPSEDDHPHDDTAHPHP